MRFRKKPIEIEAEQFFSEKKPWPEGVFLKQTTPEGALYMGASQEWDTFIKTLEGELEVTEGDWIITGVKGEKYPCKPDIFEMSYEPVF